MAKNDNLTDFLLDIAQTLRTKLNRTDNLNPQEFSSLINSLEKVSGEKSVTVTRNGSHEYSVRNVNSISLDAKIPIDNSYVTLVDNTCYGGPANIKEVKILDDSNVTTIKTNSFLHSTNLVNLTIPSNIEIFEKNCLVGPTNLDTLTFSGEVPELFAENTGLASTGIKNIVFGGKYYNGNISYYGSCLNIGYRAFWGLTSLISISGYLNLGLLVGDGYGNIPTECCLDCINLKEFPFSSSGAKQINSGAFKGCENLEEFIAPSTLEYIGSQAFWGCRNITCYDFTACNRVVDCNELPSGYLWVPSSSTSYVKIPWEISNGWTRDGSWEYDKYKSETGAGSDYCPTDTSETYILGKNTDFKLIIPSKFENDYRNHEIWGHYFNWGEHVEVKEVTFDEDEESTTTTSTPKP